MMRLRASRRCVAALTCGATLSLAAGAQAQPAAGHGPYFPASAVWYQDISAASPDSESAAVIPWLAGAGWGGGAIQIDFSIEVLQSDVTTPFRIFTPTVDFFD